MKQTFPDVIAVSEKCFTHGAKKKKKKTKKCKKCAEWTKQWLIRTNTKVLYDNLEMNTSRRDRTQVR